VARIQWHPDFLGMPFLLHLILGGAAVYRCGKCIVLNAALAAEGTALAGQ